MVLLIMLNRFSGFGCFIFIGNSCVVCLVLLVIWLYIV